MLLAETATKPYMSISTLRMLIKSITVNKYIIDNKNVLLENYYRNKIDGINKLIN